jgi:hypothetical protein
MNYRSLAAALLLTGIAGFALASALRSPLSAARTSQPQAESRKRMAENRRLLPGLEPDGAIRLPNQWSLRPAGRQIPLGDFPVNLVIHPYGRWLAALHAGYGTHEVVIVAPENVSTRSAGTRSSIV